MLRDLSGPERLTEPAGDFLDDLRQPLKGERRVNRIGRIWRMVRPALFLRTAIAAGTALFSSSVFLRTKPSLAKSLRNACNSTAALRSCESVTRRASDPNYR